MTATAAPAVPRRPKATGAVRTFVAKNRILSVSAAIIAAIVLLVIAAPFFLPDPNATHPVDRLLPPSLQHPMGTDKYGREVLSRWMVAGRISIAMSFGITLCAATLGTFIGMVAGFFAKTGSVLMRIVDAWMAFPPVLLAICFAVVMGAGAVSELIAITIIFTPFTARIIRSRVLGLATRTYVQAARVSGQGSWKTLAVHILPNTIPLAVVQCILLSAGAMLIDGTLSFLGLGVAPPTPTWGNMVAQGRTYLMQMPTLVLFPGMAIAVFVFLLNLLGSSLRVFVDPGARFRSEQQRLRTRRARME